MEASRERADLEQIIRLFGDIFDQVYSLVEPVSNQSTLNCCIVQNANVYQGQGRTFHFSIPRRSCTQPPDGQQLPQQQVVYRFVPNEPSVHHVSPHEAQTMYYTNRDDPHVFRIGPGYLESGQVLHRRGATEQPRNVHIMEVPSGVRIIQAGNYPDQGTWHTTQRRQTLPGYVMQEETTPRVQRAYGQRSMSDSVRAGPSVVSFNVDGRRASVEPCTPPPKERVLVMRMTSSQSPPSTLKKFDDIVSQRYKHQQPSVSTLTRRIGERSAAPPGATPGTPGTPGTPDPDLFSKYRFQFSSIGQLSRSGSQEDIVQESPRATFRFSDFDDMVARIREAEPVKEEDEKGREEGEGGDEEVGGGGEIPNVSLF
ncbi:hypothetical protein CAPTEDRAFT_189453 [Capitella teleta]|uniref:Uncharacterized protein n=1 Tax=Capitella teleta TaxID=283909 RepID=R7V1E8_CAPTE|nr:hypothetical protein CAPTEDRAFT_189453 [Capitella teleta]|eukprot:ELU12312.1 hypothetical protein CAPTEDRAFT_189453 [Capitella teleta]